mmetsp:Transcript_15090/g.31230  ORF Transcript_15090/g.31230 Transcript_15090/m.31230 type:complete len:405 (+) Transcript_15090:1066-2280(+)
MVLVVAVHRQRSHKGFSFVCSFDDVVVLELLRGNRIGRRGITTRMLLLLLLLLLLLVWITSLFRLMRLSKCRNRGLRGIPRLLLLVLLLLYLLRPPRIGGWHWSGILLLRSSLCSIVRCWCPRIGRAGIHGRDQRSRRCCRRHGSRVIKMATQIGLCQKIKALGCWSCRGTPVRAAVPQRVILVSTASASVRLGGLPRFLRFPPFLLLLPFVVFLYGPRGTNAVVEGRVLHALDNGLAAGIDFLGVVASKGGGNGRSVIHPALQLELAHDLVFAVGFRPALCDLVAPHVRFVQIVDKVDGQLDQEIALHLGVVGIVQPVVKVSLRSEPQHGVPAVLDPVGLLPFFHHDGAKGNPRQHKALLSHQVGLGKPRGVRSRHLLGEYVAVGVSGILVHVGLVPVVAVAR